MESRVCTILILAALILGMASPARADSTPMPPAALLDDGAAGEAVESARVQAYRDALTQYESALQADPANAHLAVSRCRFINRFTDEEYGDWIESASHEHDICLDALRATWSEYPAAKLYLYAQDWSKESLARGEALLSAAADWSDAERMPLIAALSQRYGDYNNAARAGELALDAARLGDGERVPLAVQRLLQSGDPIAAATLLRDTPAADTSWRADRRVGAALTLDDASVALAELQRYHETEVEVSAVLAARVHLRVGDLAAARVALPGLSSRNEEERQVRFDMALAGDDMALAVAQVEISDFEQIETNMQRLAVLIGEWPRAIFNPATWVSLLWVALFVAVLALLPGVLLVPVHYRGLMRRVNGRSPPPVFDPIGLRHAWWGMGLVFTMPYLAASVLEPTSLAALLGGNAPLNGAAVLSVTMWGGLANLALVSPLVYRLGWHGVVGRTPLLGQLGWVLAATGLLYVVAFVLGLVLKHYLGDSSTLQTQLVDKLINGGTTWFGVMLSFATIAILAPIIEELMFRGLMLGGMARHVSFGWANLSQAVVFALVHDDSPRFVFYLTMGLLAGALVKKTRSLLPAIALHALNNTVAFLLMHR